MKYAEKKMKMKKITALLSAALFVLLLLLTSCSSGKNNSRLEFKSGDNEDYIVSGLKNKDETNIVIPSQYDGKPVTGIKNNAFSGNKNIISVTIPEGVTYIGPEAFAECTALKEISIPDSIVTIGESAFYKCENLNLNDYEGVLKCLGNKSNPYVVAMKLEDGYFEDIKLPDGMRVIGYDVFNKRILGKITLPDSVVSIGKSAFCNASVGQMDILSKTLDIGDSAFYGCKYLSKVVLPDNVTGVGYNAFNECDSIEFNQYDDLYYLGSETNPYLVLIKTKANIKNAVISGQTKIIAEGAFENCSNLEQATIPSSVKKISYLAFSNCRKLNEIIINEGVVSIGELSFSGCSSLKIIRIPGSIKTMERDAFKECAAHSVVYYTGSLEQWCEIYFTGVSISANPLSNGAELNINGQRIEHLVIPDGVTSIHNCAFAGCDSILSVTIPEGVTQIGQNAFTNTTVGEIILPQSLKVVAAGVFLGCDYITSIKYAGTQNQWKKITIVEFGNSVFYSEKIEYGYKA